MPPTARSLACQLSALASFLGFVAVGQTISAPRALPITPPLYLAVDSVFRGTIHLDVDATDTNHKVFMVHETIPVQKQGSMILLYPQWDTGSHAATISVANLAGLQITANTRSLHWERDALNPHAFHVLVPPGIKQLNLEFQYLSPPYSRAGAMLMTPDIIEVPWQNMVLYPAGWYVRDIRIKASLKLPLGFQIGSALEPAAKSAGQQVEFTSTSLETLVDSPVYAGRYFTPWDLGLSQAVPVHMDAVADRADGLVISPEELDRLRAMVKATLDLFRSSHYKHYDLLVSLSDLLPNDGGLEHLQSSEINLPADYFTRSQDHLGMKNLIAHEYVHSWNGLFRRPAGLWTPDLNTPMRGSLLWVYEGQTEYWAIALAARAGQISVTQALDILALDAASAQARIGRSWKSLADTNNDPLYDAGHAVPWPDWQRREDYYGEGVLLWLDVDTRIRELTSGKRSLADFARHFFGEGNRELNTRTYSFVDLCSALNGVASSDWNDYLQTRLQAHDATNLLDGFTRAGYELVFSDQPGEVFQQNEAEDGVVDLTYSIGIRVADSGAVKAVSWMGPSFNAGMSIGSQIKTVNGQTFTPQLLRAAVEAAGVTPVTLGITQDGKASSIQIEYRGRLAYPHLQRLNARPDGLLPWLTEN